MPKKVTPSPDATRPAISVQDGLTSAAVHAMAIYIFVLKCLAAVMAIKIGKNVNGAHEIKLKTSYVPVFEKLGNNKLIRISAPCKIPAAAKIYTNGANTADMVAMTRFSTVPLFSFT